MSAPLRRHFCGGAVVPGEINRHHKCPQSEGGIRTVAAHARCHVRHHAEKGDFRRWGRAGGAKTAEPRLWIFNLKIGRGSADFSARLGGARKRGAACPILGVL